MGGEDPVSGANPPGDQLKISQPIYLQTPTHDPQLPGLHLTAAFVWPSRMERMEQRRWRHVIFN